jgi:hypothetical protein
MAFGIGLSATLSAFVSRFLCPAKDTTIYDRASAMKKTGVLLLAGVVFLVLPQSIRRK